MDESSVRRRFWFHQDLWGYLKSLKLLALILSALILSKWLAKLKMAKYFKLRIAGDDQNSFVIFWSDVLGNSCAIHSTEHPDHFANFPANRRTIVLSEMFAFTTCGSTKKDQFRSLNQFFL